jgi:hypothetical protein
MLNNLPLLKVYLLTTLVLISHPALSRSSGGDETDNTVSTQLCSNPDTSVSLTTACHAWGLEWQLITHKNGGIIGEDEAQDIIKTFDSFAEALKCIDYSDTSGGTSGSDCAVSGEYRLPNIKELAKMFRYTPAKDENGHYVTETGNTALSDVVMRTWFNAAYFKAEGSTLSLSTEYDINSGIEPYIMSSTYRDIDLVDGNSDVQVLLMNLMTGAIMSFNRYGDMCPITGKNGNCSSPIERDKSKNPIFVFRVKTYTPS